MASPRKSAVRFKHRTELLDFLLEVAAATSDTLDLDRLLAGVSDIVRRVIDCELLAILLYTEKYKELRIRYAVGHRPEIVDNMTITLEDGITGAAGKLREAVLVGDVRNDSRYIASIDAVRTELAVPMIARQKLVGVLDVQSTRINAYSEYDRTLLRLIASRVAVTIDNARLYRRVERNHRTLQTLSAISQEISSILDLDELLNRVATSVHRLIHYDAFSILLVDQAAQALRHLFSIRHDKHVKLDNIPLGKGITSAAVQSREPVRVADTTTDPRYIASHPGIRSEIAVPLIVKDRVIGVMDLECDKVGFFLDDHARTLSLLAPQIAICIDNAKLYEEIAVRQKRLDEDLNAASELQRLMLPASAPDVRGLEIGVGLRPAREISGDIYDFFEHSEDHHVIAFGDVSGKGVAAALFGGLVSGLLRTLAPRRRDPVVLLKALNEALVERKVEGRYVTLLVALWHPHSRELSMANAGALPPLVMRKGEVVRFRVEGVPLGLLETREYEEARMITEPGDVIVLYSDGIPDHLNAVGEEYGRKRLTSVVRKSCGLPAQAIVDAILDDVERFGGGAGAFDDQTLTVIKVN